MHWMPNGNPLGPGKDPQVRGHLRKLPASEEILLGLNLDRVHALGSCGKNRLKTRLKLL
jgi:hypothetical protein